MEDVGSKIEHWAEDLWLQLGKMLKWTAFVEDEEWVNDDDSGSLEE